MAKDIVYALQKYKEKIIHDFPLLYINIPNNICYNVYIIVWNRMDKYINAAINIKNAGMNKILAESICCTR